MFGNHHQKRNLRKLPEENVALAKAELVNELSPIEQLSFPAAPLPVFMQPEGLPDTPQYTFPRVPVAPNTFPRVPVAPTVGSVSGPQAVHTGNRSLLVLEERPQQTPTIQVGQFTAPLPESEPSQRAPLIIHGSRKQSIATARRTPLRHRLMTHVAVTISLIFVILGALISVLPTGADGHAAGIGGLLQPLFNLVSAHGNNSALIVSQAATATAVTQDGYDPGGGKTYAGVPAAPAHLVVPAGPASSAGNASSASDIGNLNRFFYGQCTYWANMHYHDLTGHWVPWLGNAYQWAYAAPGYNWVVSDTPKVGGPSIIVLQPNVDASGGYGHVAIVESINSDGSVRTSNWNWGGAWATTTYVTFKPGPGVKFVWYPG